MKITEDLFHKFTAAFSIPVHLYQGKKELFSCEKYHFYPNIAYCYLEPYIGGEAPVCFVTSHDFIFSGYIALPENDQYFIIGPITPYNLSDEQAAKIAQNIGISHSAIGDMQRYLYNLPHMNSPGFYSMLDFLRTALDIDASVKVITQTRPLPRKHKSSWDVEERVPDVSFSTRLDSQMQNMIKNGKVEEITASFKSFTVSGALSVPELAPTAVRSLKNTFISATAIVTRCALSGGLDYQTAVSLSDLYISHVEAMTQFTEVQQEFGRMIIDFTNRVRLCLHPETDSATVNAVYRYVQEHRYNKITTGGIADALGVTSSYLCHHFKEKTGKTLTQYIYEQKIQEIKYILETTPMSLVEISLKFGFSSQQQFQQIFRKMTGTTPNKYRREKNIEFGNLL